MVLVMVSSGFVCGKPSRSLRASSWEQQRCFVRGSQFSATCLIPIFSLALAILLVPEKPNQLASICEKNHSPITCQVW
tara:strand:- start:115 stop:348 length:234 start_codon:yes stop_codon:yes gene_type:complete